MAAATVRQHFTDFTYKVYVTTMLRILAQPYCENELPPWLGAVRDTPDLPKESERETSVDVMINDVIQRTGVTVEEVCK